MLARRFFGFLGRGDEEILEEAVRCARGLAVQPWNIQYILVTVVLGARSSASAWQPGFPTRAPCLSLRRCHSSTLASFNVILVYRLTARWGGGRAAAIARAMVSRRWVQVVAPSQVWAYGDRLYLDDRVEVQDHSTPPGVADLDDESLGADRFAVYVNDPPAKPALAAGLARHDLSSEARFRWSKSRPVVVCARNSSRPAGSTLAKRRKLW